MFALELARQLTAFLLELARALFRSEEPSRSGCTLDGTAGRARGRGSQRRALRGFLCAREARECLLELFIPFHRFLLELTVLHLQGKELLLVYSTRHLSLLLCREREDDVVGRLAQARSGRIVGKRVRVDDSCNACCCGCSTVRTFPREVVLGSCCADVLNAWEDVTDTVSAS